MRVLICWSCSDGSTEPTALMMPAPPTSVRITTVMLRVAVTGGGDGSGEREPLKSLIANKARASTMVINDDGEEEE